MGPTEPPAQDAHGYWFGPRDRRGLVAGVRTGQAVVLGVSCCLAVVAARSLRGLVAVPAAGLVLVAGVGIGWATVRGRAFDQWLPAVTRFLVSGLRSGRERRAGAEGTPRPSLFKDLDVVEVQGPDAVLGAVEDRRFGTLTGVLAFDGGAFGLLDPLEQDRRVAAWSAVLASLAGEAASLQRLQWLERTVPADPLPRPAELARPAKGSPGRSYLQLLAGERGRLRHELLVAVTVEARPGRGRAGRAERGSGPVPGQGQTAGAVLAGHLASLEQRCRQAGLDLEGALSPEGLRDALRRGLEAGPRQGPPFRRSWPGRVDTGWSKVRAGGVVQATYWIAEWPASEVRADFLLPLLLGHERRSVSLVMAPRSQRAAQRAAEHARTSSEADAALRARHGFALSARTRREHEAVTRREAELAAGHAGFRFSAYLGVAAPDGAALERACQRLEQAAGLARLALWRLDGCQDEALLWCLPIGRGCR